MRQKADGSFEMKRQARGGGGENKDVAMEVSGRYKAIFSFNCLLKK